MAFASSGASDPSGRMNGGIFTAIGVAEIGSMMLPPVFPATNRLPVAKTVDRWFIIVDGTTIGASCIVVEGITLEVAGTTVDNADTGAENDLVSPKHRVNNVGGSRSLDPKSTPPNAVPLAPATLLVMIESSARRACQRCDSRAERQQ